MKALRVADEGKVIDEALLLRTLKESITCQSKTLHKVLILPPDLTRMHSYAGRITAMYYKLLSPSCRVDILPALGTHEAMPEAECREFFGPDIPMERIFSHDWRNGVEKIGEVPADFVKTVSEGLVDRSIAVEINRMLLDSSYDLIISVGQVVPHEVVGMANYTKNILVGCGGSTMINESHMLGAFYGMERIMGKDFSPVRKVFDYAEEHFLAKLPVMYVLTVTTASESGASLHGLFIGRERKLFEDAVGLSQQKNLIFLDKPLKKVVVFLDEREFKSTWLGNKAVYRTRMAIADGGELIILAPGIKKFGEDSANDELIRKYGYVGKKKVLELIGTQRDLQENRSVAAHLIHGSSDGRFSITYAVSHLSRKEIEGANFSWMDLSDGLKLYDPAKLHDGYNTMQNGEDFFYISNPALGLWAAKGLF